MRRRRHPAPALTLCALGLTLLGACGSSSGGGGAGPSATPTTEATAAPAPEALSGFSCTAGPDGLWSATGTLSNDGDEPVSYTVDLYVGPADGIERPVTRTEVPSVQPGGSTPLQVTGLTSAGDPATCHVRVLRPLDPAPA